MTLLQLKKNVIRFEEQIHHPEFLHYQSLCSFFKDNVFPLYNGKSKKTYEHLNKTTRLIRSTKQNKFSLFLSLLTWKKFCMSANDIMVLCGYRHAYMCTHTHTQSLSEASDGWSTASKMTVGIKAFFGTLTCVFNPQGCVSLCVWSTLICSSAGSLCWWRKRQRGMETKCSYKRYSTQIDQLAPGAMHAGNMAVPSLWPHPCFTEVRGTLT